MNAMTRQYGRLIVSTAVVLACVLFLSVLDENARSRRRLPSRSVKAFMHVATQADAYRIYRNAGVRGGHVVQIGRHFHLEPYFPHEKEISVSFPIRTFDIRRLYEQGLNSHSWMFIANKNGLVRKVTSVLPDRDFQDKIAVLNADFSFRKATAGYEGYSYDLPRRIMPFSQFSCPNEPVVVNVDAGAFTDNIAPRTLHAALQDRCADIRMLLLVDSVDNDQVTAEMRRQLAAFRDLMERERT